MVSYTAWAAGCAFTLLWKRWHMGRRQADGRIVMLWLTLGPDILGNVYAEDQVHSNVIPSLQWALSAQK